MKFLADENFPAPSVRILRALGYQVTSVSESYSGMLDSQILSLAQKENYVILTFDKDYGELIFKYSEKRPPAVIIFRYKGDDPTSAGQLLNRLLQDHNLQVKGKLTIIEKENVRQRKY